VDWRQEGSIGCGTYRWERRTGLGYAKAERAASPDANRTLKAVPESVPTVRFPEPSFFWDMSFDLKILEGCGRFAWQKGVR
jgi:hypothetical protein